MFTALWFVRLAARELYGKREGDLSTLAFMGAAGFMWHAHEATAETAMVAGLAAAYYGVAISHRKPYKGAVAFGVGAGVAFLAKGLAALAQPLAAVLLVLPISAPFRQRSFALAVGLGLVVLAPFVLAWPALLAVKAPDYFAGWIAWQVDNISHPPALTELADIAKTFAWSLFPVWPMTLWATWEYRRNLRDPGFAVPFAATIVSLVLLLLLSDARDVDMLALLVPLSIPAGVAVIALRRGAANALAWFAMMTFSLGAAYLWLMWAVTLAGVPERLARTAARLEPGFVLRVEWLPLVFAALLTVAWWILILRAERSTLRSVTHWAAGMTLTWGLATTLWLGWIDYAKSYRPVAESLKRDAAGDGTLRREPRPRRDAARGVPLPRRPGDAARRGAWPHELSVSPRPVEHARTGLRARAGMGADLGGRPAARPRALPPLPAHCRTLARDPARRRRLT